MTFVIWMTGLPCSGKSTIARKLRDFVPNIAILDGDELREWLSPKDFSREGRNVHNRKVAYLAKLLIKHKVPVCASLISPYNKNRFTARQIIGTEKFVETYIKCSLEVCEKRDNRGMYKKARKKEIKNFTGVSDDYDVPKNPELVIDSENQNTDESLKQILSYLSTKRLLEKKL